MDSNIYEFNAASTLALYADFIDGCPNDIVVVLSKGQLSPEARTAVSNSVERLGYGEGTCCWVSLVPSLQDADGEGTDAPSLGALDVRTIIEGIDPAACIATDAQASALLGDAFGQAAQPDVHRRILGREIIWFEDFEGMLGDSDQKQRAWALLKRIGRSS